MSTALRAMAARFDRPSSNQWKEKAAVPGDSGLSVSVTARFELQASIALSVLCGRRRL